MTHHNDVGQTGDSSWRGQSCPSDIFGAATSRFMTGTSESIAEACNLNPYHVQCVLTKSLRAAKSDPVAALADLQDAAKRFTAAFVSVQILLTSHRY